MASSSAASSKLAMPCGTPGRAAEAAGNQADQWLFTLSDLMVLVMLYPRCEH